MADMTTAEKLAKVYEGVERTEELNAELEQTLYGTDTGGKSFYDEFWDVYQENGKRENYNGTFAGKGWNNKLFRPKYDMSSINQAQYMFWDSGIEGDLPDLLSQMGKTLSIKQNARINVSYMFAYSDFTRLPELNFAMVYGIVVFANSYKLITIDKLIVSEETKYDDWFNGCSELVNITIEGAIGRNIKFQNSTKLSKASITSIINALSTTTSGLTVTLSKTAVNKAFETTTGANDGATSAAWTALEETKKNWTISLV